MSETKLVKCSNPKCGEIIQWQTDKARGHRKISVPLDFNDEKFVYCSLACCVEHEATLDIPESEKFNVNKEKIDNVLGRVKHLRETLEANLYKVRKGRLETLINDHKNLLEQYFGKTVEELEKEIFIL